MKQIGVMDSFMLTHTLADLARDNPANMAFIAVREDPDAPTDLEIVSVTPPIGSIQHFQDTGIPLIGAIAMQQSHMVKTLAQGCGVGPYGAVEMLSAFIAQKQKEQGPDSGA